MKYNDKLIIIAIGSVLLAGAFVVSILISLPDSGSSSVRAQETTTPTPMPGITGEDLDRWETEYAAGNMPWVQSMDIEVRADIPTGAARNTVTILPNGAAFDGPPVNVSKSGDRVLRFNDGTSKALPEGIELTEVWIIAGGGGEHGALLYYVTNGTDTLEVTQSGHVSEWAWSQVSDRSGFSFLEED